MIASRFLLHDINRTRPLSTLRKTFSTAFGLGYPAGKSARCFCAITAPEQRMHDMHYVVELANAYNCALITRDELREEIHACSLEDIMYGVITFSEYYSDDAAAFIVAADLPIVWERWFTREELDSDPETSWMPEGTWTIDPADKRVLDFRLK
jgi:hypothetical protein